jgi:hypothetical protein
MTINPSIPKTMANTYTQLYNHFVFAVQNRLSLIRDNWQTDLYKYMNGIIEQQEMSDGGIVYLESGFDYETVRKLLGKGHQIQYTNGIYGGYRP